MRTKPIAFAVCAGLPAALVPPAAGAISHRVADPDQSASRNVPGHPINPHPGGLR